jgi:hypothetical protein
MPQETNLNISPYFDDFDPKKNFYKVLFKPGYPVQARELSGVQSILQNQVEQFGNHVFKEGSVVIPGQINYNNQFFAVEIEDAYAGIDVNFYLDDLVGKSIKGATSNVQAKVIKVLDASFSERGFLTLYLSYQGAGTDNQSVFSDGETLFLEQDLTKSQFIIQSGEGFANTASQEATSVGSAVLLSEGVYFIRGTFVNVEAQTLILDAHSNFPTYKVGLDVVEEVVSADEDSSLYDNAKGFSNFAAAGADRFKITAVLSKKPIDSIDNQSFISLLDIREGVLISGKKKESTYNILKDEIARRTHEESGDYYIRPFSVTSRESIDNGLGNNGIFNENQQTYNNNTPSENLGVYKISPGKAYVKGYDVETISTTYLDFNKPRTVRTLENQEVRYLTGSTYSVNRVYGAPSVNLDAPFIVSLRDSRVGTSQTIGSGKEIGLARVYDFSLETGGYDTNVQDLNRWDISLFDIQTYTEIALNEPITISSPKHIKGRSSGAIGYLRYDVSNDTILTLYNTVGSFSRGEKLTFDGIETDSRVAIAVTQYSNKDVQSLSQVGTSSTIFTADIVPSLKEAYGIVRVSAEQDNGSGVGIATVTLPDRQDFSFLNVVKPGNLVAYTIPGNTEQSYSKVVAVQEKNLIITGITTVSNINNGSLPSSAQDIFDFALLNSEFLPSQDNTLYTTLARPFISNVDLSNSQLIIRREYPITITSNATNTIAANDNETFLNFDEERYVLTRSDGTFETLSSDRFVFENGSKELTILGLGSDDANSRLIATLRKINPKAKIKNKKRINSIVFNRSRNSSSGIGSTSLNDGLDYGTGQYPYGTRIQDEDFCLLYPDVTKVYSVVESNNTADPLLPSTTLTNISDATGTTTNVIIGEEFVGESSGSTGCIVQKINDFKLEFSYLNEIPLQESEVIRFKESGITATVVTSTAGAKNILKNFSFNYGQKDTIYDYCRLERKPEFQEPRGKIRVVFETAEFSASDDGDIVTANSYSQFDYCTTTFAKETINNTDIIDSRLRVSKFDLTDNSRSPFEFLGRSFDSVSNCSSSVLASDESFVATYGYYLPRIDKIFLTKDGIFQLNTGVPSEMPEEPPSVDEALEIVTISLPPYLCDASKVTITLTDHKRYRMKDIAKLEDRIRNLEKFTSLSLLESNTENLKIKDANGLDRFKSGYFVDDFTSTQSQNKSTIVKNSIDAKASELRPTPYTTELDLILGSKQLVGIGSTVNPLADSQFVTDLIGTGCKRSGQLITLDYEHVAKFENPYATRTENVTPFLVTSYTGSIDLYPSSDVWIDQVRAEAKNVMIDNFTQTQQQLIAQGWDPQTGYSPVSWGEWETTWTGKTVTTTSISRNYYGGGYYHPYYHRYGYYPYWNYYGYPYYYGYYGHYYGWYGYHWNRYYWGYPWYGRWGTQVTTTTNTTTKTGIAKRSGTKQKLSEEVTTVSLGDSTISTDIVPYMRSRNIEFIGKRFKPYTRVYAFFDGQDVNKYAIPKLLEITMSSGTFQVGETIKGIVPTTVLANDPTPGITQTQIQFRAAQSNHRKGPFNQPEDFFFVNPYDKDNNTLIPEEYSTSSTILNIDVHSLADQPQGDYFGYITEGMILRGQTSGAQATISAIKLVTDSVGAIYGSYFIPNPNVPSNPSFESGKKTFRLTSSKVNSQIPGVTDTSGEETYESSGKIETIQETIQSTRSAKITSEQVTESKSVSETTSTTSTSTRNRWYGWPYNWRYRYGRYGWCRWDPLAQSFFVSEENGIFATKMELFFRTKDDKLPVIVQLRPMELGTPKTDVHPFSEVAIEPKDVNVSEDGTVPTVVEFPSPVYLKGGEEHAVVLMSESNDYNAWISRLGEVDVATQSLPESQQIVVTQQPVLGSLFKSQNGSTWDASQYEDLKMTLFKAKFTETSGDISFYNPSLNIGNKQIANLLTDSLTISTRRLRVGLSSAISDTDLVLGNTITQFGSTGTGDFVAKAGVASSDLNIINNGTGYPDGYYSAVPLRAVTGKGRNGTANISVINGEVVSLGATINAGGTGYKVGDTVTFDSLGGSTLGRNVRLSVSDISGFNEIIIDNVQGQYATGIANTVTFVATGIGLTDLNSTLGGGVKIESITPDDEFSDGLHIRVDHKNHGMHFRSNSLIISGAVGDLDYANLESQYSRQSTDNIVLSDMLFDPISGISIFANFENEAVSATNPGYILIDDEIIAYTGITDTSLTGISRGIDQTTSYTYPKRTSVTKYELSGISLRRINKEHTIQDSDITRSIGLDFYYIKLDMSSAGKNDALPQGQVDRTGDDSFRALFPTRTQSTGGSNTHSTQNIPFEIVRPIVQVMKLADTSITARIRTVSGSSVDGGEAPYLDQGFEDISLDNNSYLSSPRLIGSKLNENQYLGALPGNKSFSLNLKLNTSEEDISPVVDLDRVAMVFTSNRINNVIEDYKQDFRTSTLKDDPTAFVYATNPINLEVPASSIKILLSAHVNEQSDIRAFYAIMDNPADEPIYYPFPGFSNRIQSGQVINLEDSDGTSDLQVTKSNTKGFLSTEIDYNEFEFSIDNLPDFKYYSVKLIGTATNQAYPPRFKDLRAIALA